MKSKTTKHYKSQLTKKKNKLSNGQPNSIELQQKYKYS